jgi:hypothetical protein
MGHIVSHQGQMYLWITIPLPRVHSILPCARSDVRKLEAYCLVFGWLAYRSVLKMEAVRFTETLANSYQNIWSHVPEDSTVHTLRRENHKLNTECFPYVHVNT